MPTRYRAFVSSTSDLVSERSAAIQAIYSSGCDPEHMEEWPSGLPKPLDEIKKRIAQCDFCVFLIGREFGNTPTGSGKSYVQEEFEYAASLTERGSPASFFRKLELIVLIDQAAVVYYSSRQTTELSEQERRQKDFIEGLTNGSTIRRWRNTEDLAVQVRIELLSRIRPRESSTVVETNAGLIAEVEEHLDDCVARGQLPTDAMLIQFSANNVRDLVRTLVWRGVPTRLYMASVETAITVNSHQASRVRQTISNLLNEITPLETHGGELQHPASVIRRLSVFQYTAPGALRAVQIGENFLAIGSYAYLSREIAGKRQLDLRGGELPMMVFRGHHDGFQTLRRMIESTVENWHRYGICQELALSVATQGTAADVPRRRRAITNTDED